MALRSLFAFGTAPVLILLVILYAGIFAAVFVNDELANVPTNQTGFNLDRAFHDLHQLAARPRPYNSHANDAARAYILSRVRNITHGHSDFVHISNDLTSNVTFIKQNKFGIYFEGTNILVKIEGTDAEYRDKGGVLFSAHYDSVATAKGVSDNAMSVVACLQMIEYLVERRPKRTAVFNINNGEEDGLHGAHVFLQHPWFGIVDTFMNLEGAAAGGRPLIFRATSTSPLRAFTSPSVQHPHANVLSSDAFSRGVLRSGTDFAVYAQGLGTSHGRNGPKEGVDIAAYKHRSFYHTKYDAIPFTDGGKKALWSMMEIVRGGGWALLQEGKRKGGEDAGFYFDLFGQVLVLFTQRTLLISNILRLVLGPMIILALMFTRAAITQRKIREHRRANGAIHPNTVDNEDYLAIASSVFWGKGNGTWTKSKFWLSIVLSVLSQAGLVWLYLGVNPFIVYSHPFTVFASTLALAYLCITLTPKLPLPHKLHHGHTHAHLDPTTLAEQKQSVFTQLYILTYLLLLLSTTLLVGKNGYGVGGVYFIAALNASVWSGCVVGCVEGIVNASKAGLPVANGDTDVEDGDGEGGVLRTDEDERDGEPERRQVRGVMFVVPDVEGEATSVAPDGTRQGVIVETDATEITPLIPPSPSRSATSPERKRPHGSLFPWSLIQVLLVVPIPVTLMVHIVVLLMNAMAESLADGSSALTVYAAASFFSVLIILPLAPFTSHIHGFRRSSRLLAPSTILLILAFGFVTLYAIWKLPFSRDVPIKMFFQQTIEVDLGPPPIPPIPPPPPSDPDHPYHKFNGVDNYDGLRGYSPPPLSVFSTLTGVQPYTSKIIKAHFPSAWGRPITCSGDTYRLGLETCKWDVKDDEGMLPSPITRDDYFTGTLSNSNSTEFSSLEGKEKGTRDWLRYKIQKVGETGVVIAVRGINSRACRVYADNRVIRRFRVWPEHSAFPPPPPSPSPALRGEVGAEMEGDWDMQPGYEVPPGGVNEVRLWSRSWDREFIVELDFGVLANEMGLGFRAQHREVGDGNVGFGGVEGGFKGRIACEWVEYESATVGESGGASRGARIPAYEEVLDYLPSWAAGTKTTDGMVEVWGRISI